MRRSVEQSMILRAWIGDPRCERGASILDKTRAPGMNLARDHFRNASRMVIKSSHRQTPKFVGKGLSKN